MALPTIVFDPMFDPNQPIIHRLTWATDIITTRDRHEQRRSLRRLPRQSLTFSVDTVEAAEMARVDALLQAGSPDGFKVPMWCDRISLPVPGVSSGLRINLYIWSQAFDNAAWVKSPSGLGTAPVVTPNAGTAPDGSLTADRVQFALNGGTTTADFSALQQGTPPDNGTYTQTFWIKSFDGVSTYVMQNRLGNAPGIVNITVTGTWQKFSVTNTGQSGITRWLAIRGAQSPVNSNAADVLVWGAQFEPGSLSTDHIPTDATPMAVLNLGTTKYEGTWDATELYSLNDVVVYNGNQYIAAAAKTTNDQPGFQFISNPEFAGGLMTGYSTYDNGASGSITRTIEVDASAPNSTGNVMRIDHTTAGTPSPGFGGFLPTIPTGSVPGSYVLDQYRQGQVQIIAVTAKIPIGYTINRASNGIGTGNDINGDVASPAVWLTSQAGTGDWFTYMAELRSGTVTPWSSTGHIYLTGPSRPVTWRVAKYNMITPWQLDNISSGYSFVPGEQLIFYQNSRSYELVTISAVSEGMITFPAPVNSFWPAGTIVAPVKPGYVLAPVQQNRTFRDGQSAALTFILR